MVPLDSIETYGELEPHLHQEWLITNGIGGFASSTVVGCNTRRYHGLLCAATLPPVGRVLMLSRLGEIIRVMGPQERTLEFSVNQFGVAFHPRGDRYLRRFDLEGALARWEYEVEEIRVVKEVQMAWRNNAVGVRYHVDPGEQTIEFSLLPFVRMMDFHSLRRHKTTFEESSTIHTCSLKEGQLKLTLWADVATYESKPDWWYGQTYAVEAERGLDFTEDLYTPGRFFLSTNKPVTVTLWAGVDPLGVLDWEVELQRGRAARKAHDGASPAMKRLVHASQDFIVARKSPDGQPGSTVIAGYPWFADWGRDTMISLPGLFLSTRRFEEARQVLSVFAQYVSEGMIPNRFDDYTNEPSYNTVDASLWFIHAVFEYLRLSGDTKSFNETFRPACEAIVAGYTQGTRYNIKVDPTDGLVSQGDETTQLTWMDAKCDGVCFTPRQGKAVEINALWYHALRLMEQHQRADQVQASFRKAFWLNPFRGLADVVDGPRRDASIRPNQIFAVSLANSPLNRDEQMAIVEVVRRELLTPVGLRTLSRGDPKYQGRYSGPQAQRDSAYHNGTVWPWPMGAFLEAYIKVHDRSAESMRQARHWLEPLLETSRQSCISQIGEIFEGDEPHRPAGCYAQAWSVAEVLRLAFELGM